MIVNNLWGERTVYIGLMNGARGRVVAIVAKEVDMIPARFFQAQVNDWCALHAANNAVGFDLFSVEEFVMHTAALRAEEARLLGREPPQAGAAIGNWGMQTVETALQGVGYALTVTLALPDTPRPVLLWDRRNHHWLCLRDCGDAQNLRWEVVDSLHGLCQLGAGEASAWLLQKLERGAIAFALTPVGEA